MSFSVEWSKAATKQLLSIPKKQRLIILSWVQEHLDGCEDPKVPPRRSRSKNQSHQMRFKARKRGVVNISTTLGLIGP